MNYWERHIGDYARDTAHLSLLEHGVYTVLLDRYYATEDGIPDDQRHRIARARSRDEKAAVDAVLAEFFDLQDGIWRNGRADEEIAKFKESEPDREAKRENDRERQRRSRERRRELFKQLRSVGIVPQWDTTTSELQRLLSLQPVTPVTCDNTATQTPDTRHQQEQELLGEPLDLDSARSPGEEVPRGTEAGRACRLMREAGAAQTNPGHPDLIAALTEGVTPETLADTTREALEAGVRKPFAWAITTARGRHADGARPVTTGPPRNGAHPPAQSKTAQALQTLEALKSDEHRRSEPRLALGHDPDRAAEAVAAVARSITRR